MARSVQKAFFQTILEFVENHPELPRQTHPELTGTYVALELETLAGLYAAAYECHMGKPHNGKFFNGKRRSLENALIIKDTVCFAVRSLVGTVEGPKGWTSLAVDIDDLKRFASD